MTTAIKPSNREGLRPFDFNELYPPVRADFERLVAAAAKRPFQTVVNNVVVHGQFEPFEGFRLPERQAYLRTVKKTTKAGPWQSAHQFGMAVDFAVRVTFRRVSGWYWPDDAPWHILADLARANSMDIPIRWDRGHVEHPLFLEMKSAVW